MKRKRSSQPHQINQSSASFEKDSHGKLHFGAFLCRETPSLTKSQLIGFELNVENEKIRHVSDFLARHDSLNTFSSSIDEKKLPLEECLQLQKNETTKSSYLDNLFPTRDIEVYAKEFQSFFLSQSEKIIMPEFTDDIGHNQENIAAEFSSLMEKFIFRVGDKKSSLRMTDLQEFHASLSQLIRKFEKNSEDKKTKANPGVALWRNSNSEITRFVTCPHNDIANQIFYLLKGMKILRKKIKIEANSKLNDRVDEKRLSYSLSLIEALSLAAALIFGLIEIQPFSEYNECFTQFCVNWILRRHASMPFPVHIDFSVPSIISKATDRNAEEEMMFSALQSMRSTISAYNQKQSSARSKNHSVSPILQPLMAFLLDRIHSQVTNLTKTLSNKFDVYKSQRIENSLRRKRENSIVDGTCVICLSENPNIATLCCGNVVHFNCLAEWLSRKGTCMSCRKELPMLKIEAEDRNVIGDDGEEFNTDEFDHALILRESYGSSSDGESYDSYDMISFLRDEDSWSDSSSDENTYDDSSESLSSTSTMYSLSSTSSYSSSPSDFFTSDLIHENSNDTQPRRMSPDRINDRRRSQQVRRCMGRFCNNIAAKNCSNRCCARCCPLHSSFCQRHRNE